MPQRVHHINFIVRDLEASIAAYERILDMPVTRRDRLESRGIIAARFRVGDTWIVLVQPVRPDTVPGRHLAEHGEGFFLMSLEVDSLEHEIARLGEDAFVGPARQGVEDWRVIDLDPARTGNAQWQFVTHSAPRKPAA